MLFPCLAFSKSGKSMRVKHAVIPDGQLPTVAFTVPSKLYDPKANETEMGATLSIKRYHRTSLPALQQTYMISGEFKNYQAYL